MKIKAWLKYLIYFLIMAIFLYYGSKVLGGIVKETQKDMNIIKYQLSIFIFYFSVGLIIGVDHLISESGKPGKWRVSVPKLVFLVFPSLVFPFLYMSMFFGFQSELIYKWVYKIMHLQTIIYIILGYSIISSFVKREVFVEAENEDIVEIEKWENY